MKSRDFAYWLQGVFEVSNPSTLNKEQVTIIKNHLNLVFAHDIDPKMGDEKHQNKLNDIHDGYKMYEPVPPVSPNLSQVVWVNDHVDPTPDDNVEAENEPRLRC